MKPGQCYELMAGGGFTLDLRSRHRKKSGQKIKTHTGLEI